MKKKPLSILDRERSKKSQTKVCKEKKAAKSARSQVSPTEKRKEDHGPADETLSRPVKRQKTDEGGQADLQGAVKVWGCHSVVQRQAATAVKKLLAAQASGRHGASLKSLTLASHVQAKKATFKVTCQTLKAVPLMAQILGTCGLLKRHKKLTESMAYVLCYELLLGEGVKPHGPAERAVLRAEGELREAAGVLAAGAGVDSLADLLGESTGVQHPRTARVNLLKLGVEAAIKHFKDPRKPGWQEAFREVQTDSLLSDVLSFPAGTDLHDHPLVKYGCVILQSKASCMPAHALDPKPGQLVMDACAAPGNKTTHLAALMGNKGRIEAFDKDARRIKRLEANAKVAGARIINATCLDFLGIDPQSSQFGGVEAMLLDPSCSGSGTAVSRMDHLLPQLEQASAEGREKDTARIAALADFQKRAVLHALAFPDLRRLVYSTCSVHPEENELVVAAVLEEAEFKGFALYDPFPNWKRRGLPLCPGHHLLVRTDPHKDNTDGFFIAAFERM